MRIFLIFLYIFIYMFSGCGEDTPMGSDNQGNEGKKDPFLYHLAFTSPKTNEWVNQDRIQVKGTISASSPGDPCSFSFDSSECGEILVNNIKAELTSSGEFSLWVPLKEGENELIGTHTSGAKSKITVMCDTLVPKVSIQTPAKASIFSKPEISTSFGFEVSEENGLQQILSCDKKVTNHGDGGQFSETVQLKEGLNVLTAKATDLAGNSAEKHVSVLYGEFQPPKLFQSEAIVFKFGSSAIDTLGNEVTDYFDKVDLTPLAKDMNPVYTSLIVDVYIEGIKHRQQSHLALVPTEKKLAIHITLYDIVTNLRLQMGTSVTAKATAKSIDIKGNLYLDINQAKEISSNMDDVIVTIQDLELDLASTDISNILENVPYLNTTLNSTLETLVEDTIKDVLPTKMVELLNSLKTDHKLSLLDSPFTYRVETDSIKIDETGILLGLSAGFVAEKPVHGGQLPGYLFLPDQEESIPLQEELVMKVKRNFLNQIFYEFWRSGLLELAIDQKFLDDNKIETELVAGFLGSLLDYLPQKIDPETPIALSTTAKLPPIIQFENMNTDLKDEKDTAVGNIQLEVGGFRLGISTKTNYDILIADITTIINLSIISLDTSQGGSSNLKVRPNRMSWYFDVVNKELANRGDTFLEPLVRLFLNGLNITLQQMIYEIAFPFFDEFSLKNIEVKASETGQALIIKGELVKMVKQ